MLIGALIVLLCAAGGSAVFVLEQVHSLRDALSQNGALRTGGTLANAGWGDPQTLLLVGNDTRKEFKYYRGTVPDLANEMLLVRLDPSKPYISMMSIPRELWVTIYPPGQLPYTNRINSAYTHGIGVLVSTIHRVLGLSVNHVIVTTFGRFQRAINEMGCVYSTVDRRYYNLNIGTPDTNYQSIDLQPGYQQLCGSAARQFVSYRHGDTSQVRDARDQSFLLDVKKQYGPTLSSSISRFEHIFGQAVQTDAGLQSTSGLLSLIGTLINSSGLRVRQVHFQANLLPTFDTATPQQIAASVHDFLHGASPVPKQSTAAEARKVHSRKAAAQLPLVPVGSDELAQARASASQLQFPLEFPRVQDRAGSFAHLYQRSYLIHAPGGDAYPAYVSVFSAGQLGQFYDVQGTTWTTAPQFDSPDQTVQVGGRTYYLFFEGSNLRMVAWYENDAVYWVRNSLTDSIGAGELLGIAEQTTPFTAAGAGPGRKPVILKAAGVPARVVHEATLSTRETVGSVAGIVTLVALPLLALLAILLLRELRRPRMELASGREMGSRLPGFDAAVPGGGVAAGGRLAAWGGGAAAAGGEAPGAGVVPRSGIHPFLARGKPAVAARPGTYAPPRWTEGTRTYRHSRLRTPAAVLAVLLVLAALAAGVVFLLGGHGATASSNRAPGRAGPVLPTVPVAVLNAGSTPGAAGQLASQLRGRRVSVSEVKNVSDTLPPGLEVLYAPGQREQAMRVARLFSSRAATVGPIDPVIAAAAGTGTPVVVVIT